MEVGVRPDIFAEIIHRMDRITQIDQLRSHLVLDDMANLDETFASIADALLNNFVIAKGNLKSYRILEIEFYHNLAETEGKDKTITYKRSASAGQWFFHSSGVDICFESSEKCYGGILIRAIKDMTSGKTICGPYNVMDALFDKFDALEMPSDFPLLRENHENSDSVISDVRWHPRKEWPNEDDEKKYRFYLPEDCWGYDKSQKYPAYPFEKK